MNKERRKEIAQAMELLTEANGILETVRDAEQEAHDALPEGLQNGTKGEEMQENVDALQTAYDAVDTVISDLGAL